MGLFRRKKTEPSTVASEPSTPVAVTEARPKPDAPAAAPSAPSVAAAPSAAATPATTSSVASRFDRLFADWMSFPTAGWSSEVVRVERDGDDGTLVVRAELEGLDPAKDIELTVSDGVLWIDGAHQDEQRIDDHGTVRHEVTYQAFSRSIPLPDAVRAKDIQASATGDVLEIRIPGRTPPPAERVPIASN